MNADYHLVPEGHLYCLKIVKLIRQFKGTKTEKMRIIGVVTTFMIQELYKTHKKQQEIASLMADATIKAIFDLQEEQSK